MFNRRYQPYLVHLKGSRRLLVLALLAGVCFAASSALGIPFLIGKVLPAVFGSAAQQAAPLIVFPAWLGWSPLHLPKGHEVTFAVAFLPAVFCVRGLSEFSANFLLNLAGLRVVESVRRAVFARLQRLHLGFFAKLPTGDLLQRVINDANSVRTVLVDVSNDILIQPLTLLFALGYVTWICLAKPDGYWFLGCLLVVPVAVFLVRSIGAAIQRRARAGLTSASDLNGIAVENLQSAREVRAYGLQDRECARFDAASREGLRIQAKLVRYEKALSPLLEISAAIGIALAIGVGDATFILQYSTYSVISPEGCASILWKDAEKMREAAEALRLTAQDLQKLAVIDRIVTEPLGGAQRGRKETIAAVGRAIEAMLRELSGKKPEALIRDRREKFLDMGTKGLAA
mgnify:CR=1 FL=1